MTLSQFIKRSWTNLNIRCGKYRHLRTVDKCVAYDQLQIEFTREEYREWCESQRDKITSLDRPSLDRLDSTKNYSLSNIQIVELSENIARKRPGSRYLNGPLSKTVRGVRQGRNGKWIARITYHRRETYLGTFETRYEAEKAFARAFYDLYGRMPW